MQSAYNHLLETNCWPNIHVGDHVTVHFDCHAGTGYRITSKKPGYEASDDIK